MANRVDLSRFIAAQEGVYQRALGELREGRKRSHWMWFIFPQVDGLGFSSTSRYYAIKSREETREYLAHPVLGKRLAECAQTLLALEGRSASAIFGYPDDLKLRSSMTLFAEVAEVGSPYARVLDAYFAGDRDSKTIEILRSFDHETR